MTEKTVESVALASHSSFLRTMKLLPKERRRGLYSLYSFCREVDDLIDNDGSSSVKKTELFKWMSWLNCIADGNGLRHRENLPSAPMLLAQIEGDINRFSLPLAEFHQILLGMRQDLDQTNFCPSLSEIQYYARRVAGAVGLLCLPIFGVHSPENPKLALLTGEALQITNILRDIEDDISLGRCYIPKEFFEQLNKTPPRHIEELQSYLAEPSTRNALEKMLLSWAHARFLELAPLLEKTDITTSWPIHAMSQAYFILLHKKHRHLQTSSKPFALSKWAKAQILLRTLFCRFGFPLSVPKFKEISSLPDNFSPPPFNHSLLETGSLTKDPINYDRADLPDDISEIDLTKI